MITYSDIIIKKFYFTSINLDKDFCDYIWSINLPDTGKTEGEVQFKLSDVEESIRLKILRGIKSLDVEKDLMQRIEEFHFDINRMRQGEWVPMHNEVAQKSPFEIILWLTQTDDYEGREFVMKDANGVETYYKPKNGDICLLDTTQPDTYHGVNKLISDTEIISIVGGLLEWENYEFRS